MPRLVIPFVLLLLVHSSLASAQTSDNSGLKNIAASSLVVENMPSNDCGLAADDVRTSIRFILSQSRFRVSDDIAGTYLYARVTIFQDCSAADVLLELKSIARVVANNQAEMAILWEDGDLLGGGNMHARVLDAAEELTKKFVADWSAANP